MTAYAGLFGPATAVPVAFEGFASASFLVYPITEYTGVVTLSDDGAGGAFNPPTLAISATFAPRVSRMPRRKRDR